MNIGDIVVACTANVGRSPLAAASLARELATYDAHEDYHVRSAGTMVEALKSGNILALSMLKIVDIAAKRGSFPSIEDGIAYYLTMNHAKVTEESLRANNYLERMYQEATERFSNEEHAYRAEAAQRLSLNRIKARQDQLTPDPQTRLILVMDEGHVEQATAIYANSTHQPRILTLPQFALNNLQAEPLASAFGGTQEQYNAIIDRIVQLTPLAAERIADERP